MSLIKNGTLLYAVLRPILRSGARIFMRRIHISGMEKFPQDKPVILISNHQNAMLDPVLLCVFAPKQLHWLARADVFKNPLIKKVLFKINMMPVYRERDGVENLRDENNKVFEECFSRLGNGAVISLFPEGTHRGRKELIPFKKGLGRLATGALESKKISPDLCILPVGLDYSSYYDFGPELLIKVGDPIRVIDFYTEENSLSSANDILLESASALNNLMINIIGDEWYDEMIALRDICFVASGESRLDKQFDFYRAFTENARNGFMQQHQSDIEVYLKGVTRYALDERESSVDSTEQFLRLSLLALFLPVYLLGRTFYFPIERLINGFVRKNVKDPLFYNSIRLAFWTILGPIYTVVAVSIIGIIASWTLKNTFIIIALVMLSGRIALEWVRLLQRCRNANKWLKFVTSKSEEANQWISARTNILNALCSFKK